MSESAVSTRELQLQRLRRLHELLDAALDLDAPTRRQYLEEHCADDPDLALEVWQAAAEDDETIDGFLESPAFNQATPSSSSPPSSVFQALRSTRGISLFLLIACILPLLIIGAVTGASSMLGAAQLGLRFSPFTGKINHSNERWQDLAEGDRILAINGESTLDVRQLQRIVLSLSPGPVTLKLERDGEQRSVTGQALPTTAAQKVLAWTRVATGTALLLIALATFVLRPGATVSWLFLVFCTSLGVHLLSFLALLRWPPENLLLEYLGLYLAAASGLHLFLCFPKKLLHNSAWAALLYLPAGIAVAMVLPRYQDIESFPLVAQVLLFGPKLSVVMTAAAVGALLLNLKRATDRIELARARALLVAVGVGLLIPAVLGVVPLFRSELNWLANAALVSIFAALTAYTLVRHNALEVDRFTATVLGYATTTLLLASAFVAALVGLPALAGHVGLVSSPLASTVTTAIFFVLFNPVYRRVKQRVDQWFRHHRMDEETALRRLARLTDSVRSGDLDHALAVGLAVAETLDGERAEIWLRELPQSDFIRWSRAEDQRQLSDPPSSSALAIPGDGALAEALDDGSGGLERLSDRPLTGPAQEDLWQLGMVLAAPIFVQNRLAGILTVARKRSGFAYARRERVFLDAIASHLAIALERQHSQTERVGPYKIVRRLGVGGMAEVFLAERHGPGGFELEVAIKRLMPHLSNNSRSIAMLLDEARIAARLRHPNIVRVFDVETYGDVYCLAMEYIDGPTLAELIQPIPGLRQTLPLPLVAAVTVAVAAALDYSHQLTDERGRSLGLVHRDVKPANILLSRQGEIKLADFGIARAEFRLQHTRTGNIRGTPPYLAPEVLLGEQASPSADVFALAAVVYEAIGGRLAFPDGLLRKTKPPPLSHIRPGLPEALDDVMFKALAEKPADRFASASDLATAMLEALGSTMSIDTDQISELITDLWHDKIEAATDPAIPGTPRT